MTQYKMRVATDAAASTVRNLTELGHEVLGVRFNGDEALVTGRHEGLVEAGDLADAAPVRVDVLVLTS